MSNWQEIADRAVRGLGVRPGELIQVREHCGRWNVVLEMLLAVERAGATPLPELTPPTYLRRLLNEAPLSYLLNWDEHRLQWMEEIDRVLVLQGIGPDVDTMDADMLDAWSSSVQRLTELEETRRLPYMLVGVPTKRRAQQLGQTLDELEAYVMPALHISVQNLRRQIENVLDGLDASTELTIVTGDGLELHIDRGKRRWLTDDGYVDEEDRIEGAIASNLPAGAVYTTILEDATEGQLQLPHAAGATNITLTFESGEIVTVEADRGAGSFRALLERHTGDCRRLGHIGIGLNPNLDHPVGWTIIDEHVHGALFVSLGENRYMGGQNNSSLNIDFALTEATLLAEDSPVILDGKIV